MKDRYSIFIVPLLLIWTSCVTPEPKSLDFNSKDSVELFELSSGHFERDLAIAPDGLSLYYTLVSPRNRFSVIIQMSNVEGRWSEPIIAPFSGQYEDLEPAFHPDGTKLYFASKRPVEGKEPKDDFDIWFVMLEDEEENRVERLSSIINSTGNEYYPSITKNGSIYFTASYESGKGTEDIFYCEWTGDSFLAPVSLDTTINTKGYEFNAFVDPNEEYLLFTGYGRADGLGGGDLYISHRSEEGKWGKAKHLGQEINTEKIDYCPFVWNGTLFFSSERFEYPKPGDVLSFAHFQNYLDRPLNGNSNIFKINFDKALSE